jgi:glycosyltransferase involved in cell wall biosynthesis
MTHRILTISHAHPDFSLGGGEIAAYNLHRAYQAHPDVAQAFFLARHGTAEPPTGKISIRRENEFLWDQSLSDGFMGRAAKPDGTLEGFANLLRALNPTIVHAHHYWPMGLEYFQVIRTHFPRIKLILTLHEFLAVCFNNGQMVKPVTNRLCFRESPADCQRCFPHMTAQDFWLRKHRYQSYFSVIDHFVAPSDFLRHRYIDWGIAPEKIVTIENGQTVAEPLPPRPVADGQTRNRFGFFGQINPYKGVSLLLQGLAMLKKSERRSIVLEVHGANLEGQSAEFQHLIAELREPLEKEGSLQWIGPYEPFQMASRMAGVDWVVIPSIWWENSPMVIQEAFALGRPLVGSDIGGMAEKITHDVDGVHVPVGNARAWGDALLRLSRFTTEWDRLRAGITPPVSHAGCAAAHLDLGHETAKGKAAR